MSPTGDVLFVAVHKGPYLSIQPLEKELGPDRVQYLVDGITRRERDRRGLSYADPGRIASEWGTMEDLLRRQGIKAVVRSTSEDVQGENVEDLASRAAQDAGVPVFVVEDFPGNYRAGPGERLDGLFVEDGSLVCLHQARGVEPAAIHPTGNPRYGALVDSVGRDERRARTRTALGLENEPAMLWAGQPDGDNSYRALERLLAAYGHHRGTLLFRAHPRDEAYATGKYEPLLASSSMTVVDTSSHDDVLDLYCASDLVATQFSSAGVEASYLGTPALFVLFDDLGKEYLRTHKGYETLPWSEAGAAFLIQHEDEAGMVLEQALFDGPSRDRVQMRFRDLYGSRPDGAAAVAGHIRAAMGDTT